MDAAKHTLGISSQNALPIIGAAAAGICLAATGNDAAFTVLAADVVVVPAV